MKRKWQKLVQMNTYQSRKIEVLFHSIVIMKTRTPKILNTPYPNNPALHKPSSSNLPHDECKFNLQVFE